jgi:hypothetical protein
MQNGCKSFSVTPPSQQHTCTPQPLEIINYHYIPYVQIIPLYFSNVARYIHSLASKSQTSVSSAPSHDRKQVSVIRDWRDQLRGMPAVNQDIIYHPARTLFGLTCLGLKRSHWPRYRWIRYPSRALCALRADFAASDLQLWSPLHESKTDGN